MASFPDSVHEFRTRRNLDASGLAIAGETLTVPLNPPYTAYLQEAPKLGTAIVAIRTDTQAELIQVSNGQPLAPTQFSSDVQGTLLFHPSLAGVQVRFAYTGRGTTLRAQHFNEVQDEVVAIQQFLDSSAFTGSGAPLLERHTSIPGAAQATPNGQWIDHWRFDGTITPSLVLVSVQLIAPAPFQNGPTGETVVQIAKATNFAAPVAVTLPQGSSEVQIQPALAIDAQGGESLYLRVAQGGHEHLTIRGDIKVL